MQKWYLLKLYQESGEEVWKKGGGSEFKYDIFDTL
jgi:hypothetical protein